MKMKALTVQIPELLHRKTKTKASSEGKKLREYIIDLIVKDNEFTEEELIEWELYKKEEKS